MPRQTESHTDNRQLYHERRLGEGYPNLDRIAHETFVEDKKDKQTDSNLVRKFRYLDRLIDVGNAHNIAVVGCGPLPIGLKRLITDGFNAVGVEPVPSFVENARDYLEARDKVLVGQAESMPFDDNSQDIVLVASVMEHVDSPSKSLDEIYRVLKPGGVVLITTTNRHLFSPSGRNGEFNIKFFNWFPALVQESYVFSHLHYRPHLSNGTERPAVHWYTFTDLCRLGRHAGFAQFYSLIDLLSQDDAAVRKSWLRRSVLRVIQTNAWLRAFAISQSSGHIIMLKRRDEWTPPKNPEAGQSA